jgi:ABC-type dipeptide/oligopeptide/nickel transport system permease component
MVMDLKQSNVPSSKCTMRFSYNENTPSRVQVIRHAHGLTQTLLVSVLCWSLRALLRESTAGVVQSIKYQATGWTTARIRVRFPAGAEVCLFTAVFKSLLGPSQHPIQSVQGMKRRRR